MPRVKKTSVHPDASSRFQDRTKTDGQYRHRRANRGNGQIADWSHCEASLVIRAIAAVTRTGGAVRFGYTSDKGAFAIGILGDGDPYTDFVRPTEDINEYLRLLVADYESDDPSDGGDS